MARKPNYRYERAERERLKAQRQAERDRRKVENRGGPAESVRPVGQDPANASADAADDISEPRHG